MQADIDGLLAELEELSAREGGMWNVGPQGGAFLAWLIRATNARRVLEVGTSNGYSAIWMGRALAAQPEGGVLITLEVEPRKIAMAHENLKRAGLSDTVRVIEGPGVMSLKALGGVFDLVFIDADKPQYTDYLHEIRRLLHPGSIIIADNMTTHPEGTAAYRAAIHADGTLDSVTLPIAGGFLMSRFEPPSG